MNEKETFLALIAACRVLVTECNKAALVLSEEFQSMITGPAGVVEEILKQCPAEGVSWDGTFSELDVEELIFEHETHTLKEHEARGVRLVHTLSGLVSESYSGLTIEANRQTAMNSLERRVNMWVGNQRRIGQL